MQIIEQTDLGVRSAVMTFERTGSAVRFVVVPMMHVAAPSFYREVTRRLQPCHVVVAEGVQGGRARILTLAYRLAGRFRRSGLVQQSDALDLNKLDAQIVRPDLNAEEFARGWSALRWWLRVGVLIAAPVLGLVMLIVGLLRVLGSNLALDDLPSPEEEDLGSDEFDQLVGGERDRRLVAELFRQDDAHQADPQPWLVGVPWGAEHVRAIAPALIRRGYQIRKAEWVTLI